MRSALSHAYNKGVDNTPVPMHIEVMDDEMAEVIRSKTAAERLRIANDMWTSARRMLLCHLRHTHPDWDDSRIQQEAAHRLSHGSV